MYLSMLKHDELMDQAFSLFDGFFNRPSLRSQSTVQVRTEPESYQVQVVAPGYDEKELNVTVKGRTLQISGKHEKSSEDKGIYSQLSSFEHSWSLPEDVVAEHIDAEYKSGILTLSLPRKRAPAIEAKTIPIKALNP